MTTIKLGTKNCSKYLAKVKTKIRRMEYLKIEQILREQNQLVNLFFGLVGAQGALNHITHSRKYERKEVHASGM